MFLYANHDFCVMILSEIDKRAFLVGLNIWAYGWLKIRFQN